MRLRRAATGNSYCGKGTRTQFWALAPLQADWRTIGGPGVEGSAALRHSEVVWETMVSEPSVLGARFQIWAGLADVGVKRTRTLFAEDVEVRMESRRKSPPMDTP